MEGLSMGSIIAMIIVSVILSVLTPLKNKLRDVLLHIYRKKDIKLLEKNIEFIKRIKESGHELSVFLFSAVFKIFALIGILLLSYGALADSPWEKLFVLICWLCGAGIYWIACDLLGTLRSLKNYDKTIDRLSQKIKRLKDKIKNKS